jgi:flagellin
MIINHNIAALNTYRQLTGANNMQGKSMEKLSSGLRINRAGDDAAGLAISEKMRGQIRGLEMAQKNSQDGISLIQTAEGALNETHSILQRMRELAVQASNDTNTASDRGELQKEINQLVEEIDRIADTTEFNTKKLLNGSSGLSVSDGTIIGSANAGANTQQGTYTVDATSATLATAATLDLGAAGTTATSTVGSAGTITLNGVDIQVLATDTYQNVADKINSQISGVTADFGGTSSGLRISTNDVGGSTSLTLTESAATVIADGTDNTAATGAATDTGSNATGLTASNFGTGAALVYNGNQVTVSGGTADGLTFELKSVATNADITVNGSLSFHIGANENQTMNVSVNAMDATNLGVSNIDVTTSTSAENAITTINNAIESVSAERSKLGAYQNRLEHTINNLGTSAENLTAAESRIRDVDMAKEMMNQTKNSILAQAAQAMLAQANQQPQGVLQLLR